MYTKGFSFTSFNPVFDAEPRFWRIEFIVLDDRNETVYICRSSETGMLLDWTEKEIDAILERQKELRDQYPESFVGIP